MSIHDLGFIFKDLTVIENNNISSPILYLNSKDYKKFHEEFKEYEITDKEALKQWGLQ